MFYRLSSRLGRGGQRQSKGFRNRARDRRKRQSRFEALEKRELLAAAIFNNALNPADVAPDASPGVTPLDALIVINELVAREHSDPVTSLLVGELDEEERPPFFDVNCDGRATPLDALSVINVLIDPTNNPVRQFTATGGENGDAGSFVPGVVGNCFLHLIEGQSLRTEVTTQLSLPDDASGVRVTFESPEFDLASANGLRDAFELRVTDLNGVPVTPAFRPGHTANFNVSEVSEFASGGGTTVVANPAISDDTFDAIINLSHLPAGTEVIVSAYLINNDGDDTSSVVIRDVDTVAGLDEEPFALQGDSIAALSTDFVNFAQLEDVTDSLQPEFGLTSFSPDRSEVLTDLVVTNQGRQTVTGQLIVVVDQFSDVGTRALDPDGLLPDGRAFFNLTDSLDGPLRPGESTTPRTISFSNPSDEQFDFRLISLGDLNVAPGTFSSVPTDRIEAGDTFRYVAQAVDDDGDSLVYSLVVGPETAQIDADSGELIWPTSPSDLGNHNVAIRATDPFGLFVEQSFTVEVVTTLQNRPPNFVTDPVTEAVASSGFEITTVATGNNPAGISVIDGFLGPRLVSVNAGDETVSVHAGENNDRFDDTTIFSTGQRAPDGSIFDVGFSVDVGLPPFARVDETNAVLGLDQGDFNGDGILDLAALTFRTESDGFRTTIIEITRVLGDGNGGFGEPEVVASIPTVGGTTSADDRFLTAADINNDGHLDLVSISERQSAIVTVLGVGDGSFQPAQITELDVALNDFLLADVDSDGILDLVGRDAPVTNFGWQRGLGDGTFGEFVVISPGGGTSVAGTNALVRPYDVVDIDGDGDQDIVLAVRSTSSIDILLNDGNEQFSISASLPINFFGFISGDIEVHDITGDGNLDILSLNGTSVGPAFRVFAGDGSGANFTLLEDTAEGFNFSGNAVGSSFVFDIDQDGDLDVGLGAVTSFGTQISPQIFTNDGAGIFSRTDFPTVDFIGQASPDEQQNLDVTRGVLFGDYNQDGVTDFTYFTSGNDFNGVGIRLGTRPGEFGATRLQSSESQI